MNCAHARTQNARKRRETGKKRQLFMLESTFHKDGDEIGSNRAKKGHLVLESTIFSKLAGCQWVNAHALSLPTSLISRGLWECVKFNI